MWISPLMALKYNRLTLFSKGNYFILEIIAFFAASNQKKEV